MIKHNLTPSEYLVKTRYTIPVHREDKERWPPSHLCIQSHTNIPTPNIRCAVEDDGRYYIITNIVPGVTFGPSQSFPMVRKLQPLLYTKELEGYVAQMRPIKSSIMGCFLGDVILPYRVGVTHPCLNQIKF